MLSSVAVWARPVVAQTQQAKLTASDAAVGDFLGWSVSISGDTAIVGSRLDDHAGGTDAGSAYVFVRSGGVWTQQQKLVASDAAASDWFGISIALSGDTAVVGAYQDDHAGGTNAGSVYVFVRSGAVWAQQAKLVASDAAASDLFGQSVSISSDTIIVGAHQDDHAAGSNAGSAYAFVRSGGVWTQQAKLTAADAAANDLFGYSVSISGDTAIVGAYFDDHAGGINSGSAYVFLRSSGAWAEQTRLTASDAAQADNLGSSVSVAGDTAVVGAHGADHSFQAEAGAAYVYTRSGGIWSQQAKLVASDPGGSDQFGFSVSCSGDTAVVGSWRDTHTGGSIAGSAYVFARSGAVWSQQSKLIASDAAAADGFGCAVSVDGDSIVIGSYSDDFLGIDGAGSAYVFVLPSDGACCLPSGECQMYTQSDCTVLSGSYRGDGTTCPPTPPCPQPFGACCMPLGNCQIKTSAECAAVIGASYRGDDTTCPASPPCGGEGDANSDLGVNGLDVDCFVGCAVGSPGSGCNCGGADLDGNGVINSFDVPPFVCILLSLPPSCTQ